MDEGPSYWQQQYDNARPTRAMLWCAAHRRLVRVLSALLIGASVALLVSAVLERASIVSPIINVLVFSSQFYFWGFSFPRQVDQWHTRQDARGRSREP